MQLREEHKMSIPWNKKKHFGDSICWLSPHKPSSLSLFNRTSNFSVISFVWHWTLPRIQAQALTGLCQAGPDSSSSQSECLFGRILRKKGSFFSVEATKRILPSLWSNKQSEAPIPAVSLLWPKKSQSLNETDNGEGNVEKQIETGALMIMTEPLNQSMPGSLPYHCSVQLNELINSPCCLR